MGHRPWNSQRVRVKIVTTGFAKIAGRVSDLDLTGGGCAGSRRARCDGTTIVNPVKAGLFGWHLFAAKAIGHNGKPRIGRQAESDPRMRLDHRGCPDKLRQDLRNTHRSRLVGTVGERIRPLVSPKRDRNARRHPSVLYVESRVANRA